MGKNESLAVMSIFLLIIIPFVTFNLNFFDINFFILVVPSILISYLAFVFTYEMAKNNSKIFNAKYDLFYNLKNTDKYLDLLEQDFLKENNKNIISNVYIFYISYSNNAVLNEEEIEKALYENRIKEIFNSIKIPKKKKKSLMKEIKDFNTNNYFRYFRSEYETKNLLNKNRKLNFFSLLTIISFLISIYSIILSSMKIKIDQQLILKFVMFGIYFILDILFNIRTYYKIVKDLEKLYKEFDKQIKVKLSKYTIEAILEKK